MLGRVVRDPQGNEGERGETPGLRLLDIATEIGRDKGLIDIAVTDQRSGWAVTG